MRLDARTRTNRNVTLNLDEWSDEAIVTNSTAINVGRLDNDDVFSE